MIQSERLLREARELLSRKPQPRRDNEYFDRRGTYVLQVALDSIPMKGEAYRESLRPMVHEFVAVVGATRPKQVFYGNNRADFSAIPGNVAPGLLFRNLDHFENFDDWPFLWGQNEGTIAGNTQYIIFGFALKDIVGAGKK